MYKFTTNEICLNIFDLFEPAASVGRLRGHPFRIRPNKPITANYERSFLVR